MSRSPSRPQAVFPHEVIFAAALLMSAVMAGLLLTLPAKPGQEAAVKKAHPPAGQLGSAFLDLEQLARANSIDEVDNVRWSLVRGTPGEAEVYSPAGGVDWQALRSLSQSGSYNLPAGSTWSFNATFGDGPGYKVASGVLAGGHCALATVFRAASIQAGLPTQASPHRWPITGFPLDETVTIWWGIADLVVHNNTGQDLQLFWNLSPQGIKILIRS